LRVSIACHRVDSVRALASAMAAWSAYSWDRAASRAVNRSGASSYRVRAPTVLVGVRSPTLRTLRNPVV
jgi:hypothetical protein